jgi:hypothetical protein
MVEFAPSPNHDPIPALIKELQADRHWLLRQLDGGRWPELRLDLAALERELGQLLELAERSLVCFVAEPGELPARKRIAFSPG